MVWTEPELYLKFASFFGFQNFSSYLNIIFLAEYVALFLAMGSPIFVGFLSLNKMQLSYQTKKWLSDFSVEYKDNTIITIDNIILMLALKVIRLSDQM